MPGQTFHNQTGNLSLPKPDPNVSMDSSTTDSCNGQTGKRRKKRKGRNSQANKTKINEVKNIPNSGQDRPITTTQPGKMVNENSNRPNNNNIDPSAKRKDRLEKKESVPGNGQEFKPVVNIKTPQDYSANWKMLKEVRNSYILLLFLVLLLLILLYIEVHSLRIYG